MGIVSKVQENEIKATEIITVKCDACGGVLDKVRWCDYKKCVKPNGEYFCRKCAANNYKRWISFQEWCYLNLSQEDCNSLLNRWDYELNGSVLPNQVSFSTNKRYWFKCGKGCSAHVSELKSLNSLTNKKQKTLNCSQCKISYMAFKNSSGVKKVPFTCPHCSYIKEDGVSPTRRGFISCPRCSDGISYPEKFVFNFLSQLNIAFKTQLSKSDFLWCDKYRYDFYLIDFNTIIETHGMQHYKDVKDTWGDLETRIQMDSIKKDLAIKNGIKNYIVLDCSKSEQEWIKKSLLTSCLSDLFTDLETKISWDECHKGGCSTRVKEACSLWESKKNINEIAALLSLSTTTIRKYLKMGEKINWCSYNAREALKDKSYIFEKVVCLNTGEVFNSVIEASKKYNIAKSSISACCLKASNKSAGKLASTGESLVWVKYAEFLDLSEEEIFKRVASAQNRIICLNTGEVFNSIGEATAKFSTTASMISSCCNGLAKTAGKIEKTGEKLKWAHYRPQAK